MKWDSLRTASWQDWIRIILAIDIASVGLGMILGFDFHSLALLLGVLSKIVFGIGYIFIAAYLFGQVFSHDVDEQEKHARDHLDTQLSKVKDALTTTSKKIYVRSEKAVDHIHTEIDTLLDKGEDFLHEKIKRKTESNHK